MTLKSYFSATVEAAMVQAARELGPEAMLVYSREAPPEVRSWGRYEVVFGWDGKEFTPEPQTESQPVTISAITATGVAAKASAAPKPSVANPPVRLEFWQRRLAKAGFSDSLAESIARRCQREVPLNSGGAPSPSFWDDLRQWIPVADGNDGRRASVIIVAGPPGAGKSSALANLAFRCLNADARPVHLVATDTDRICGGLWLERVARLAEVSFSTAESLVAFEEIIRSEPPGRLILAEASTWLGKGGTAWSAFRRRNPGIQVHVLAPVTHGLADLRAIFHRFQGLEPDRIIAARLDESSQRGAVCSIVSEFGLPLSYFSTGEAMPDSLERASLERFLDGVVGAVSQEAETEHKTEMVSFGGGA